MFNGGLSVLDRVGPCYLCGAIPPKKNKRLPVDWIATDDGKTICVDCLREKLGVAIEQVVVKKKCPAFFGGCQKIEIRPVEEQVVTDKQWKSYFKVTRKMNDEVLNRFDDEQEVKIVNPEAFEEGEG